MENIKIISDNGVEINVNGLFYVFNSKYYFIYTLGEIDENEYIKLYVVQVCKEVQTTPTGPVDTGYMIGIEISNTEEWIKVQESITKIVDDKKNNTQSSGIQYLPINMLVNLKIVSKNKFKLMKHIVENNFKVLLTSSNSTNQNDNFESNLNGNIIDIESSDYINNKTTTQISPSINDVSTEDITGDVIIDYRASFFEEQAKSQALEEQIKSLNEKLENIKNIIG